MYYSVQRYSKSSETQNNLVKIGYFDKKSQKSFVVSRKSTTFAPANRNKGVPKRSKVWGMV